MKLKTFDTTNVLVERKQEARIHINISTGLFTINKTAADLMALKAGEMVCLHQDEDEKENWYIEKVKKDGFSLRYNGNLGSGVFFNSAIMARMIVESVEADKGGRVKIGEKIEFNKRTLWTLVTTYLKNNLRKAV